MTTLTEADHSAIAEKIVEIQRFTPPDRIRPYTTADAARYVGKPPTAAGNCDRFYDWAKRWKVRGKSHGRWFKDDLDAGLSRERSGRKQA